MLNRRGFLQGGATMAVAAAAGQIPSHHSVAERPYEPPPDGAVAAGQPVSSGSGDFRYDYVPDKLALPPEVKMKNGHGLCRDSQGNIYFTFEPEQVAEQTRCLVRFAPDGTAPVLLGADNGLAHGVPHGLNIHVEKDGRAVLYHANNDATVHKTTLEGKVLWTQKWSAQMGNYKPTDAAAPPESDRVMVADGYGSSMIHVLKAADGIYAGKSWGGLGHAHGEFNCPHGITFDSRRGLLLTADRGNKRLEYFDRKGFYHSTIEAKEITAPCNADVWGDYLLVPDLDGPLVILDRDNRTVSVIEVGRLMGHLGFRHPHDAIWLANGDIAACFWNPGRIAYFRKHAAG
jgi:hypothetical protein